MDWIQTWANYYDHITRDMTAAETHEVMAEERKRQQDNIQRAQEHLDGVTRFYKESSLADPDPPGEKERDVDARLHDDDPIAAHIQQRELSDREI